MRHGTCKHFGSAPGGRLTCGAGHDIRELVGGEEYGWMRRVPCHDPEPRKDTRLPMFDPVSCSDYIEPTAAEVAAYEVEVQRVIDAVLAGKCPTCGGPLEQRGSGRFCRSCHEIAGCNPSEEPAGG